MDGPSPGSPTVSCVDITDYDLQLPAWSLENLKLAASQLKLGRPRSLAWAILLNALPPPNTDIVKSIKGHRNFYNDLRSRLSRDPRNVIGDDPLSQNEESAWKQHFCDNELKALILQDVVRTFPDELYFRDKDVQDMMVRVLFCWSREHPTVGYRQGMHEILATLIYELYLDRKLAVTELSDTLKYYLDDEYLEHDSFMLVCAVLRGVQRLYCSSHEPQKPSEVVRYLEKIKDEILRPWDPELTAYLDQANITMELFGIRWVRLLFGREFPRPQLGALWGAVFRAGARRLPAALAPLVAATLHAHRDLLVGAEPGSALRVLMRPSSVPAAHVWALAAHMRDPRRCPRPQPRPQPPPPPTRPETDHPESNRNTHYEVEEVGEVGGREEAGGRGSDSSSEGVAEGGDVARELAALALLRARLPAAAAALAAALPQPAPRVARPLNQILQLAALVQCRNHALIDVETALEAAEAGVESKEIGRRLLVPVALPTKQRNNQNSPKINKVREFPLKVFHRAEGVASSDNKNLPFLDPLRLRTE